MSAFVVSSHHIDLLVSVAVEWGLLVRLEPGGEPEEATASNAQAIGLMLWSENVRSVVYRYCLFGTKEEADDRLALIEYHCQLYSGVRVSAAAKAVDCYDYQACECPDYPESAAAFFVRQLREVTGERPKSYEAEPWGFDSAAQVQAARDGAA